jgi:5'-nucleotidase
MRILLSNDDGVQALGLNTLAKYMAQIAEVVVVAPDRNRSGASNSLTLENPLRSKMMENNFISVEGTPTDCVHLALTGLLTEMPDLVMAGINHGANLGDDVFYSGTVAAAMEGRFLGYPALAISLVGHQHFDTAAIIAKNLVQHLHADPLPAQTILSVNVPDLPLKEVKGFEITRLGTRHRAEKTLPATDIRGNTIYWIGPPGPEQDAGPGTDFHAVNNGYVSVTPLQLDLTHYAAFEQLAGWMQALSL